jgi:hypothetical protein
MNRDLMPIFGWVGAVLTAFFLFGLVGFSLGQEGVRKDCDKYGQTKADNVLFRCERVPAKQASERSAT